MATRFDVERAVLRSGLPAGWRHLCHVLCTYVDQNAGVILPRWQPSLTQLARDTGLHRRTIMRYLNGLEKLGWVTRQRPAPADARAKHSRTHYAIRVGTSPAQASDSMPPDLGTQDPRASGSKSPGLGTRSPVSRGTSPHQSSRSSRSSTEEIQAVIDAIRAKTGITVTDQWAERVAEQILGARDRVRDPVAVLRAVIGRSPGNTYAPTPQPPRYTKEKGFGAS